MIRFFDAVLFDLDGVLAPAGSGAATACPGSIALLAHLRTGGIPTAVVSARASARRVLAAARLVSARPERSALVAGSVAGVAAGRAGGFACVIGVARDGDGDPLRAAGADLVVTDPAELLPRPATRRREPHR